MSYNLNHFIMARKKQCQNMDKFIASIEFVLENRSSLSDKDVKILNDALNRLRYLKQKKGRTNEQFLDELVPVIVLLSKFFGSNESNDEDE